MLATGVNTTPSTGLAANCFYYQNDINRNLDIDLSLFCYIKSTKNAVRDLRILLNKYADNNGDLDLIDTNVLQFVGDVPNGQSANN